MRDPGSERIFPSCPTSAQESAGEKQAAFLLTGPQHGVSNLAILRKGQLNQPPLPLQETCLVFLEAFVTELSRRHSEPLPNQPQPLPSPCLSLAISQLRLVKVAASVQKWIQSFS